MTVRSNGSLVPFATVTDPEIWSLSTWGYAFQSTDRAPTEINLKSLLAVRGGWDESVTVTVTSKSPASAATPVMTPVSWLRSKPFGSLPPEISHLRGGTPPVAAKRAVYSW